MIRKYYAKFLIIIIVLCSFVGCSNKTIMSEFSEAETFDDIAVVNTTATPQITTSGAMDIVTTETNEFNLGEYQQINSSFRWYYEVGKVALMDGEKVLDTIEVKTGTVEYKSDEFYDYVQIFNEINFPPYFIISDTFEYHDRTEKTEIEYYNIYTSVDNNIKKVNITVDNGELEYLTDPFLYGLQTTNGFEVYLKPFRYIELYGKYIFTYNVQDNSFNGVFTPHYDSVQYDTVEMMFKAGEEKIPKLIENALETEYSNNPSAIFKHHMYNYSKITEVGFRNEEEYLGSLKELFKDDVSQTIYNELLSREGWCSILEIDGELYSYLPEGGGLGIWEYDVYFDNLISYDNFIKVNVVFLTKNDSALYTTDTRKFDLIIDTEDMKLVTHPFMQLESFG